MNFSSFTALVSSSLLTVALMTGCSASRPASATTTKPGSAARTADGATGIPDRPEKLTFAPLTYEPPNPADSRVPLKAGPIAYVVPDRELPLVNISILIRCGTYLDPAGKEGLAAMTGYLLTRGGTASRTAEELEERMDFLAAQLGSGIADTQGSVSLNLLTKDLDEGLALLRDVLTAPRFQDDKLALRQQQVLQEMKQRNDESPAIEARERRRLAFGPEFFVNDLPVGASVEAITKADLRGFHQRWIHPANFVVAASGDFDRADMIARLEKLFADWPFKGEVPPAIPTDTKFAPPGAYIVNKDVNQGRVAMLLPGVMRTNPDVFSLMVMNDILGGGGFTSRVMNRVRSEEGLAYSAGTSFPGGVYYPSVFMAGFQTKSRTVAYASSIVIEEMKRMAAAPVSAEELETTKRSFIDTFPETFSSKARVAGTFAQDEFTGWYREQPDYWKNFRRNVAAVTAADVQRVAAKYLTLDQLVLLVVGNQKDILLGHPNHAASLTNLVGGRLTEVPLRDPLTLQPLAQ